jgi:dihydroflavonol-4-reductase
MTQRVLVTGISGYVGQHVGAELLRQGFEVVGTVRSLAKAEVTKKAIAAAVSIDRLTFAEADLLADHGWEEALRGCDFVLHVASPFVLGEPKNENDLITPAVEGTRRVLQAAQRARVKRAVVTSSIVSMTAGKSSGTYGPAEWSDTNANIGAYAKSKTLAERAAWTIADGGPMELVVINPGFIVGPSLGAPGEGVSVTMIGELLAGKMPMIPDIAMGMVDVRDVARLEVAALTAPSAPGHRFIAASASPVAFTQIAQVLRGAGYDKVPTRKAPNLAIKLMALFDAQARAVVPQLGVRIGFDTRDTTDLLGWSPTPIENTLVDMAASLTRG